MVQEELEVAKERWVICWPLTSESGLQRMTQASLSQVDDHVVLSSASRTWPALPEPTPAHFGCQVPEAFKVKGCCQLPACNSCGKSRTTSPLDGTRCAALMVSVFFTQPFWPVCSLLWWVEEVTERKEMTAKGKQSFPIGKRLPEQSNSSGMNDHMRNAERCQFTSDFVRPPIHLRDTLQTRAL